ncbi:MAG: type I restriction endonuclease subunit R [Oscillospiraceae bacterium]|nr:type I restriction endonuclease subunit R [Oscillospiraceae bacterium]
MGKKLSEYDVENFFVERLEEMGYTYANINHYEDLLVNFRVQFCKLNEKALVEKKGVAELSDAEFNRILIRLENHSVYESARILREQWVLTLDNGKTVYVRFLTNDPAQNFFQVANQITMDKEHRNDVLYKNRYDVSLLINGLPLVQVELKRPGVEINEAINQINRYRAHSFKGLFNYIQVFVVSNSVQTKYFANANLRKADGEINNILKSLVFYWTDDENRRINKLNDFTTAFLEKFAITEMLTKYFVIKETEPVLMVMRPYQIYAVKKALDRIKLSNMNGYVFHTTGSGKTLTSFKLATLLRDDKSIDKVFFLIDRSDLDDQTVEEYNSFEKDCVDNTDNTYTLVNAINNSSKTLIITTIQKMATAIRNDKYRVMIEALRDKKCIFIIDECHRSQFGKMHTQIEKFFNNANYIGFTGTPIFEENKSADRRTTADVFKTAANVDSCIHKYMIKEAIADGNVLRFSVEYLRSINIKSTQDPTIDVDKLDDPEYCKRHNIDMNGLYHEPERFERITKDILNSLEKHTRPQGKDVYTAIFAVDKIETLMEYYRNFKKFNDKGYKVAAIFTYGVNEDMDGHSAHSREYLDECISDYNEMFGTNFDSSNFDGYRVDISKRMKQKNIPQIDLLLVVNMFLTGFDSKPTNSLFLDKDLQWHSLLQAYSRTNRVDKPTKLFGQIITYRNIKKAQDDALKLFSGDSNPNEFLLQSYDYYTAEFRKQVEALRKISPTGEDAGYIVDEDEKKSYVLAFRLIIHTLATLKTFSRFDWEDLKIFLDEDEFEEYKSWYLTFYDEMKRDRTGKETVLVDVNFDIELIRTDKINVVYILNLLKEVNRKDKKAMEQSVDLILREIERSDNENLRYKSNIMKEFITTRFFELDPEEDLIEAFSDYLVEARTAKIEEFATAHSIEKELIESIMTDYQCNERAVTKETLRKMLLPLNLGLIKTTKLINDILFFVKEMYNTFTAAGE